MYNKNKNLMYLVGSNIVHSQSPSLYNAYFKENGLTLEYKLYDTNNLNDFITEKCNEQLFGFNVTTPFKSEIIKYVDDLDEISKKCNSINLVINKNGKLHGYNTDGLGFFESLKNKNIQLYNQNITIIGFGGAGRSISAVAKMYGINNIYILDHNTSKKLFNFNKNTYDDCLARLSDSSIIVNASNVGFNNNVDVPIPETLINDFVNNNKNFTFVDIIYNPKETRFLKKIKSYGIKHAYNGEDMLKYQFKENIKILFK